MKRETKVGLLIGLAIIILVGVLVTEFVSGPVNVTGSDDANRNITEANISDPEAGPIPPPGGSSYYTGERSGPILPPQAMRRETVDPAGEQDDPQPSPRERTVEPVPAQPQPVRYRVKDGDRVWTIAERFLGDGNRWTEIRDANSDRVGPNGEISPNITLTIPVDAAQPRATADRQPTSSEREASAPAHTSRTTKVQSGDTLWEIAQRELGDGNRYREIFELNRDKLRSEDSVTPGQTLKLPAR